MANFTYIENAHVFSKAPVQLNMEASTAVNKSVHTVQSNEIWGEVCPFITRETVKDLKEDTLFELDGYAPVKFNYKKPAIVLDAINNNGMKSNGYVAKVIIDNKPITQFIADTDVTDATGKLASGYRAVLYDKTGGEVADSFYTINYSNGLIYFREPIESTLDSHYTLSFFTYEGVKLDTAITDIKADVLENANKHSELSEKVDNIEDDYKEADIEINNNISNLSSKVADNKEKLQIAEASIENLDERLIVIEENILDLDENISKHASNSEIHVSEEDRELWTKGGNMSITGDNFITPEKIDTGWSLSLNTSNNVKSSTILNENGDKKVPTVNAVTNRVNESITLHERNKNHLEFNQISFALSGGHLSNKISNEIKESPTYTLEYTEDRNINPSEINYIGLIVKNKSPKGLNAFFKKLTIKKVQSINVSKLYAHITRSAQRDVTNGLLENKEYILTLEADITTPGEITLDFGNKLIISKEYWYGIEFTESKATTSAKVVLNYNNFANVNYDPFASDPSYPSLMTNEVLASGEVADITYNIPCVMEFEDYEIPTSNTVLEKVYGEVTLDNYNEENTNYSQIYGFIIDENVVGYITNIKVKCIDWENDSTKTVTYLKILDENNNTMGRSTNTQIHGMNKELSFDFSNIELKKGNSYKAVFENEEFAPVNACVRVNYEGERYYTSAALHTPIFDTNYNMILKDGLKSYAIVKFTFEGAAGDVGPMSYNTNKAHVIDRVKHIFPDGYIHDDTKYNNTPLIVSTLGYGFMWKPEKSAHISSISITLHCKDDIYYYNPGNLENTIRNAQSPVGVCLKITDTANNKVIGTSKLIQIMPGLKDRRQDVITVPFEVGEYAPCVKNKTYLVTFHSSPVQETPDVVLPIYPSIYEDELPPASDDYTIKKLIIDKNKTTYYTDGEITNKTHDSSNQTPMWPVYLEKLCVKVTTHRYTHPELDHIADAIGDIWEYLATIRNYISQS
jgi:hypothetical protein